MNYAELVEKARETYESEDTPHVFKAWLLANIIYPADESEDEKIRKALIDLVKCNERSGYTLLNNISTSSMLDWLEKQGERLDADKVIEWLDKHAPTKFEDMQNYVNQFKKDFVL